MRKHLSYHRLIAFIFFFLGIIGMFVCKELQHMPYFMVVHKGHISPFDAEISAIYPGCIFLLYLSLVALCKQFRLQAVLVALGLVFLYGYIQLFLIGTYTFCVDTCVDDKDAVIAVISTWRFIYYLLGVVYVGILLSIDTYLLWRKKKSYRRKRV